MGVNCTCQDGSAEDWRGAVLACPVHGPGIVEGSIGLAQLAIALARERFPEATEVRINEFEINDDSAYVAVAVKLPPQYPTMIEIQITEQKPNDA